jgi:hypothetical protein
MLNRHMVLPGHQMAAMTTLMWYMISNISG